MLQPGSYTGKIESYAVEETKQGANQGMPKVHINFVVATPSGGQERVRWTGYFTKKAKKNTLETLAHCGLSSENLRNLPDPAKKVLAIGREMAINVIHEPDQKDASKMYAKVRWVNPVGGRGFGEAMSTGSFQFFINSSGLQGEFHEIAKSIGVPSTPIMDFKPAEPEANSLDNIPF